MSATNSDGQNPDRGYEVFRVPLVGGPGLEQRLTADPTYDSYYPDISGDGHLSIAFTDALPLSFEGAATVPNLSLKNVGKPSFDDRQARILSDMYAGHHLEAAVSSGLELRHVTPFGAHGQVSEHGAFTTQHKNRSLGHFDDDLAFVHGIADLHRNLRDQRQALDRGR